MKDILLNLMFSILKNYMRKHRVIKLITTERRRKYLVSEPNYHSTKLFTEKLLALKMKETEILLNKPIHLGLSLLELSKNINV